MNYSQHFQLKERPNGESFICLKDDAPIELREFVQAVHFDYFDGCLPNDWIYETIHDAFEILEVENLDNVNIEGDPYYNNLRKWLENPFAHEYCNQVMSEVSYNYFFDIILTAQGEAKRTIYSAVNNFLMEKANEK